MRVRRSPFASIPMLAALAAAVLATPGSAAAQAPPYAQPYPPPMPPYAQPYPQPMPPYAQPYPQPMPPYAQPMPPPYYYQPLPRTLPWKPGQPVPPNYRLVTRPRSGPLITSAIIGPIFYMVSAFAAVGARNHSGEAGFMPVVGPFIAAGAYTGRPPDYGLSTLIRTGFVFGGIGQVTAIGLLILGFAWPQKVLVLDQPRAPVAIAPSVVPGGLGFQGTF